MWQKINAMVPKQTLINLLISLSGVLIIVLAGIVPNYITSANLDRKISGLQFQIEEQKTLYPIYQLLKDRSQKKMPRVLPLPVKSKLSRGNMRSIPTTFKDIARSVNMNMVSISPDLNSLRIDPRFLPVDMAVAGDFFNFRKFLIALVGVPYLERIEELQIRQNQETMEFKVKICLAINQ
jgi:hypothetical protein